MPRPFASVPGRLALVLGATLTVACITTVEAQSPGVDNREIAKAITVRSWLVQGPSGPALGSVVRLESASDPERFYFAVRNLYSQDLGLVDALGRVYRHRPHAREAERLGAGTVAEGAARILESEEPVELIEIALSDLETRLAQERGRVEAARRKR